MNDQEPELKPRPSAADSAKTDKPIQRQRSEFPLDQRPSYLKSGQIALKKFSIQDENTG
jgi:hypothetical protein